MVPAIVEEDKAHLIDTFNKGIKATKLQEMWTNNLEAICDSNGQEGIHVCV